jgi:membrane protein
VVAFIRQIQRLGTAATERYEDAVAAARKRSGIVDNFWAAKERYSEVLGGRLAAAIAYYGFFAAFALSLVAFSIFGVVLDRFPSVKENVTDALAKNLPNFPIESIADNAGNIALVGVIGLLFTGLGWVDAWRSSQRAIWKLDQHPGNVFIRRLVDLGMLVGLALVLILSLALADLMRALFRWISNGTPSIWNTLATGAVTVLVNVIIAYALLTVLPRIHVQPRRLIPPAVLVGIGLSLLNLGGRAYVTHATRFYAAYAVIATAAGLLIYLYLFNQIVLWGAAIAATSNRGRFIDLAAGPAPESGDSPSPDTTGHPET